MGLSPHVYVAACPAQESVAGVAARLAAARRVLVVGNGGIALELMCGNALTRLEPSAPCLLKHTYRLIARLSCQVSGLT